MLIIGIAGGTGSGKTTVVRKISERISGEKIAIIPQDAYYYDSGHLPLEERKQINFDHPDSIEFSLLVEHVKALRDGQSIEQPTYSYLTCTRQSETVTVKPCDVMIIEGILVLTHPELRDLMDIKVYVDADDDDRLARIIRRDVAERGRTAEIVLDRYAKTVKPMHLQFIEPSKRFADLIVPQGGNNEIAIGILTNFIKSNTTDK